MKKALLLVCLAALTSAAAAQAQGKKKALVDDVSGQGYGMAGCGLGSIVFGDKPGMVQVIAATVNGTFYSQTFGLTSGTSNCDTGSGNHSASNFITANRVALQKDIARGNGETVMNLAEIMGCKNGSMLGSKLQQNFGKIFPDNNVSTDSVVDTILSTVKSDSELSKSCDSLS